MKPIVNVDVAVIVNLGKILVCQRRATGPLPDFWEFPGGKREVGESGAACVIREVKEEVDLEISVRRELTTTQHEYPTVEIRLHAYLCKLEAGTPRAIACQRFEWIDPLAIADYEFPPANAALLAEVIRALSSGAGETVDFPPAGL